MSACISRHGEYSDHELGTGKVANEFICARCGAFLEDAALDEIERLRGKLAVAERAAGWHAIEHAGRHGAAGLDVLRAAADGAR